MHEQSPQQPPPTNPGAPMNAPPSWRPMSGLALTAFILSLLLMVIVITGWWWLAVVPFGIGLLAAVKAVPEKYRGRGLAIAGVVISAMCGSCAYQSNVMMHDMASHPAEGVLRPLAAEEITEEERDHRLADWVLEDAVEEGRLEELKSRFAMVVERMGPYQGGLVAGTLFSGTLPLVMGPQDAGLVQVDDVAQNSEDVVPGQALWSSARFEQGDVWVAVFLNLRKDLEQVGKSMTEGTKARVVTDLRFYLPAP